MTRTLLPAAFLCLAVVSSCAGGGAVGRDAGGRADSAPSDGALGGDSCPGALTACMGACTDTATDPRHCGGCGMACATGEVCSASTCMLSCGGMTPTLCGTACVDTMTDRLHCGGCDMPCAAGEVCNSGSCMLSCGGSTPTLCGTACVDTTSDPRHCGGCDMPCAPGDECSASACRPVCTPPEIDCAGACVDTTSDESNCGACGMPCTATETCTASMCRSTVRFTGATGTSWMPVPGASGARGLEAWIPAGSTFLYAGSNVDLRRMALSGFAWTTLAPPPARLAYWGSPAESGGAIWELRVPSIVRYDPTTSAWTTVRSDVVGGEDDAMTVTADDGSLWTHVSAPSRLVHFVPSTGVLEYFPTGVTMSTFETRVGYDTQTNSIYFGGFGTGDLYRFDISTSAVTTLAPHPEAQLNDIFCTDHLGHIYAAGGSSGTTIWQYTIASNAWAPIVPWPIDHGNNGSCGVSADGWLYMEPGDLVTFYRLQLL